MYKTNDDDVHKQTIGWIWIHPPHLFFLPLSVDSSIEAEKYIFWDRKVESVCVDEKSQKWDGKKFASTTLALANN
jgi:hypothetical protein